MEDMDMMFNQSPLPPPTPPPATNNPAPANPAPVTPPVNHVAECHKGNVLVFDLGAIQVFGGGSSHSYNPSIVDVHVDLSSSSYSSKGMNWKAPRLFKNLRQVLHPAHKVLVVNLEITDMQAPAFGPVTLNALWKDLEDIAATRESPLKVLVSCVGGHGRTGTVLAALGHLKSLLGDSDELEELRNKYCKRAVESESQINWLRNTIGLKTEVKPSKGAVTYYGHQAQKSPMVGTDMFMMGSVLYPIKYENIIKVAWDAGWGDWKGSVMVSEASAAKRLIYGSSEAFLSNGMDLRIVLDTSNLMHLCVIPGGEEAKFYNLSDVTPYLPKDYISGSTLKAAANNPEWWAFVANDEGKAIKVRAFPPAQAAAEIKRVMGPIDTEDPDKLDWLWMPNEASEVGLYTATELEVVIVDGDIKIVHEDLKDKEGQWISTATKPDPKPATQVKVFTPGKNYEDMEDWLDDEGWAPKKAHSSTAYGLALSKGKEISHSIDMKHIDSGAIHLMMVGGRATFVPAGGAPRLYTVTELHNAVAKHRRESKKQDRGLLEGMSPEEITRRKLELCWVGLDHPKDPDKPLERYGIRKSDLSAFDLMIDDDEILIDAYCKQVIEDGTAEVWYILPGETEAKPFFTVSELGLIISGGMVVDRIDPDPAHALVNLDELLPAE